MTQENLNTQTAPAAEFDWSMDKEGFSKYSKDEQARLEGLYENTLSSITEREIVKGTVVGFTEKEAKVYLTLLRIGKIQIHEIAHHTGIKRTTLYTLIPELQKKGFVKKKFEGKKKLH